MLDFFTFDFHRERTKLANSNNYKYLSRSWKEENALRLNNYPKELRGFSQNRFGGQNTQRLRTYRGKFGPAGPVRHLTPDEIKAVEQELRKKGRL